MMASKGLVTCTSTNNEGNLELPHEDVDGNNRLFIPDATTWEKRFVVLH